MQSREEVLYFVGRAKPGHAPEHEHRPARAFLPSFTYHHTWWRGRVLDGVKGFRFDPWLCVAQLTQLNTTDS